MKTSALQLLLGLIFYMIPWPSVAQLMPFQSSATQDTDYLSILTDRTFRFDTTFHVTNKAIAEVVTEDESTFWKDWKLVENFTFGKDRGDIPMIADLRALHPYFRDKVIQLINLCRQKGIELAIAESYRTHAKQAEYFGMGRKYTRTAGGKSKHQYGLAVDLVPIVNGEPQWENKVLWKKIGILGESLGLRWGGRWRSPYDPAHFEWTGGYTTYHLANGLFPPVPKQQYYPCLEEDLEMLQLSWDSWEAEQSSLAQHKRVASEH